MDVDTLALLRRQRTRYIRQHLLGKLGSRRQRRSILDGELGLGSQQTVVSRFRRVNAQQLVMNDNNDPLVLNIGNYFDVGGGGNNQRIYFQTLADGVESFAVAGNVNSPGTDFVRFDIPQNIRTLLGSIAEDRPLHICAGPDGWWIWTLTPVTWVGPLTFLSRPSLWCQGQSSATASTLATSLGPSQCQTLPSLPITRCGRMSSRCCRQASNMKSKLGPEI